MIDKNVFYPHIYLRYPGQKMRFTYANPRQKGISCGHYRCKNIFYLDIYIVKNVLKNQNLFTHHEQRFILNSHMQDKKIHISLIIDSSGNLLFVEQ